MRPKKRRRPHEIRGVDDGLVPELCEILAELGVPDASKLTEKALIKRLRREKTGYATKLADRFRADPAMALRGPEAFRAGIGVLVALNRRSIFDEIDS